ncbi:hypothetical protein [Methylobacterium nigriterrae]|uniref:hypothetical protein n=1 Tax=Methylobacterium nigriterrae TaxID=3127512 RepID=UPI003013AC60
MPMSPSHYRLTMQSGAEEVVLTAQSEREMCIDGEKLLRSLFWAELPAKCLIQSSDAASGMRVKAYFADVLAELRATVRG